jgi:hypothetical protein
MQKIPRVNAARYPSVELAELVESFMAETILKSREIWNSTF